MKALHTMYDSGVIRDQDSKIVGFYDRDSKKIHVDGTHQVFTAIDESHAMDILAETLKAA